MSNDTTSNDVQDATADNVHDDDDDEETYQDTDGVDFMRDEGDSADESERVSRPRRHARWVCVCVCVCATNHA